MTQMAQELQSKQESYEWLKLNTQISLLYSQL